MQKVCRLVMNTDGRVLRISLADAEPTHAVELRQLLIAVLNAIGRNPAQASSLSELIATAQDAGLGYSV
jgi:hypothetical protein